MAAICLGLNVLNQAFLLPKLRYIELCVFSAWHHTVITRSQEKSMSWDGIVTDW